jgi:hypothetical protein
MRLRGQNRVLRWLSENRFLIVVATFTSILSYFTIFRKCAKWLLNSVGLRWPDWLVEIITFCVCFAILAVLLLAIKHLAARGYQRIMGIYFGNLRSGIWPDGTGIRTTDFEELRSEASESMLVMGVGMTLFSRELRYLEKLLERDLTIKLLMFDPDILYRNDASIEANQPFGIKEGLFDDYFDRPGYSTDVRTSCARLMGFIEKRKKDNKRKGRISLRKYQCLVPMNVTMIDENSEKGQGKMLIEWCLPFSDCRMFSRLSLANDEDMFRIIKESIEDLWRRSIEVSDDFAR